jgi:hypothetical protein
MSYAPAYRPSRAYVTSSFEVASVQSASTDVAVAASSKRTQRFRSKQRDIGRASCLSPTLSCWFVVSLGPTAALVACVVSPTITVTACITAAKAVFDCATRVVQLQNSCMPEADLAPFGHLVPEVRERRRRAAAQCVPELSATPKAHAAQLERVSSHQRQCALLSSRALGHVASLYRRGRLGKVSPTQANFRGLNSSDERCLQRLRLHR